jgi:uronate dehydrogenase
MKTILITGAAGRIGSFMRAELANKYKLRLSDINPIRDLNRGETFVRADISNLKDALRITKGVDAVVHFGGQSGENTWERILNANIIGFYNTLEAARQNGVKRFLVATSNHAVGFYPVKQTIDHRVYPKPDSRYGVSKVFNEALASLYADRYGMEMFCMRIGNVNREPIDRRRLAIWISPRDMAQLVTLGIERPKLKFEVVYGISDNRRTWFDNRNARRLGYRPKDRSEPYAKAILQREGPPGKTPADIFQGGGHCMSEGGTRSRLAGEAAPAPQVKQRKARPAVQKPRAVTKSAKVRKTR